MAVAVLFLAAGVRMPSLTWRSLNGDEGASLYFSSLPYGELLPHFADLSIDRHPLLYYVALKAWRDVAGDADVALRLPSALAGMLTVALMIPLGRRLGAVPAVFAALFVALNPLALFVHQDVRMYALGVLFVVLAAWAALTAPEQRGGRRVLRCAIAAAALVLATYTHLIGALLFPVLGLIVGWQFIRGWRAAAGGLTALAVAAAASAPYLVNILRTGQSGSGSGSAELWLTMATRAAGTLLAFERPLGIPDQSVLLLGLLAVLIAAAAWRGRGTAAAPLLWFMLVMVLTTWIAVRIQFYQAKSFAFAIPPLALLAALACLDKARRLTWPGTVAALAMLALTTYATTYQWRVGPQDEDFRGAARFVQTFATPRDRVVLHLNWYQFVFGHYYPGDFAHPFPNNVDAQTPVEATLQPYLDGDVLWLVEAGTGLGRTAGDPGRVVEHWLAGQYPVVTEVFPNGVDVRGYVTRFRFAALPETATPVNVTYPDGLALVGYRLAQREFPTADRWLHPPSTWVPVTLYWSTSRPLAADVHATVLLEGERGEPWGGNLQRERTVAEMLPAHDWQPGEIIRWDFDVNVNPLVPPGEYKLVVRVYRGDEPAPLLHAGGQDWLILDRVMLR